MGWQRIATWFGVIAVGMAAAGCQTAGPAIATAGAADPAAITALEGRYLTVWRRSAGAWKVVFDGGWGRRAAGNAAIQRVTPVILTGACEPGRAMPAVELQSLDRTLSGTTQWRPQGGAAASSGDVGYTFGLSAPGPDAPPDASYGHVWCRRAGQWQLLLELRRPLPAASPPPQDVHAGENHATD